MKRHIIINVCADNLWNKEAIDKIEGETEILQSQLGILTLSAIKMTTK